MLYMLKNRRLPPLNALKAFEATARHQSITKAAEELCVTQAAVSQQVKQLESYLDVALLVRQGRKITLTDEAKVYLPVLNSAFDALAIQTKELFGKNKKSLLNIRCTYSFSRCYLAERLANFIAQHPDILVRLVPSNTTIPEDNNQPDIEILNGYGNWLNCNMEQITNDEWVVVASDSLLVHYPMPTPIYYFANYPKISTIGYRESWQDWFAFNDFGAEFSPAIIETTSSCLAIEMAESGAGFLLVKRFLVQKSLAANKLKIVCEQAMPSQGHHYLISKSNGNKLAIETFRQWLVKQLAQENYAAK